MANHKSAKKRNRQNVKRNIINKSLKSNMKTVIKKFRTLSDNNETQKLKDEFKKVQKTIDMTAQKGVIHQKTGSRYISRLQKLLNK